MKNKILLLGLLLITGTTLFSQVKVRPGIRLAMNIANISGLDDSSSKVGLNVGAFANVHFTDFYELQLELAYSDQGANIKNNINEEVSYDLDYITIGLMNKLFIKDTGLHFIVGPSVDITHDSDAFLGALFPTIDFALTGGLGYEFPFGLAVEARYKQGLIDLDDGFSFLEDNSQDASGNFLNTVFQVGVSYKFDF